MTTTNTNNATADLNTLCLDMLGIQWHRADVLGATYLITDGTGDGIYAYTAESIERESATIADRTTAYSYAEFCEAVTPAASRELAVALAATEDTRICVPGSTASVLSSDEYMLVRQVAELLT